MHQSTQVARLQQDLAELQSLLRRAEEESQGSPDDVIAQRLFRELIQVRNSQLASAAR